MKRSALLLITMLLLCFHPAGSNAQQAGIEFLTTGEGLSQGYISKILQDREGFIWICTKNGLNRYDGYRFEVFSHDPYDIHTLAEDHVISIAEYGDFLVIGTITKGLNLFHKRTGQVYRIPNEVLLPDIKAAAAEALWAAVDSDGNIWAHIQVEHQDARLVKVTFPEGFWNNPAPGPDWQQALKATFWPRLPQGFAGISPDAKIVYAPSRDTIFRIEASTGRDDAIAAMPHSGPHHVNIDRQGRMWITTHIRDGGLALHRLKPEDPYILTPVAVPADFYGIQQFTADQIWLACYQRSEVYRLDDQGHFDLSGPTSPAIQVPMGPSCSMTDRSGIVWVGTNGLGILKVNQRSRFFRHLFAGRSVYGSILQDRPGNIYTSTNLLERLYSPAFAQGPAASFLSPLENMHVGARMLESAGGGYWLAGLLSGSRTPVLKKTDPAGQVASYSIPSPFAGFDFFALAPDDHNHPWIAAAGKLLHFDPVTARFETFDFRHALPDVQGVTALTRAGDGSWWIGLNKGLIRGKPAGAGFDFQAFTNNPATRNSLRENSVSALVTDPADPAVLWIGTKGGGLNRLDTRTLQFTHLTTREGLPNDVIYGVLADDSGNLWMSSNKGLIRYTPASGAIKNYTEEDGVQANEFNTWAFGKGPDGTLLFGGVNGLTVFNPRRLQVDTVAPRTLITNLRLNDRELTWNDPAGILTERIEFTQEIVAPYARNSITLEFAAMSFVAPSKNRFRYYLEGAEKEWSHESGEHSATYLNLPPGRYVFKVKGANSEGVWSTQAAELKITVLPPWYRTWWAYLGYLLIVGGGIYLFYRHRLRTELEHAENLRLKEMDAFKTRFFTNITHEFRTPLTVILGMTEQLKRHFNARAEAAFEKSVDLVHRNGRNLLQLINQILDLAKLESGKLSLQLERSDVVAFTRYAVESFRSYAESRKVQLHFLAEIEELTMDFDREKLQTIVSNLLSNAVKFTPASGNVYIHIGRLVEQGRPRCQIKVRDTGIGIPGDQLGQIFDRFYQVDHPGNRAGEGTGIGLALTKELVRLLHGEITVQSKAGAGTICTVLLPVTTQGEPAEGILPAVTTPLPAVPAPRRPAVEPDPEKPLLLVVEDNEDVRQYLADCVSGEYQVLEAHNGRTGIEKALETVPDLIVSDVMMPEQDGFELCRALKSDPRTSHIPIVLLTAKADAASRIQGLSRGADDYLAKPFDRIELLVRLRNLLDNRRRLQARYAALPPPPPGEDPDLQPEDAFLLRIRRVVETHIADADFEMPHLERALGMSRSQIFRKVKALTGQSPSIFIRSMRLQKARELLHTTQLSIAEIAYEVGFSTPAYFSTAFLEAFGKNPSDFRQA